jgi:hypothetical protein
MEQIKSVYILTAQNEKLLLSWILNAEQARLVN